MENKKLNKSLLLIDKYKQNCSPIIGAVTYNDKMELDEKIILALSEYFNCNVKNLKYKLNEKSDINDGIFTMINDKEQIEMDFEIHNLNCF